MHRQTDTAADMDGDGLTGCEVDPGAVDLSQCAMAERWTDRLSSHWLVRLGIQPCPITSRPCFTWSAISTEAYAFVKNEFVKPVLIIDSDRCDKLTTTIGGRIKYINDRNW